MRTFTVVRRVDAYVDYLAGVDADDAAEAVELAQSNADDYEWKELGACEFDARGYVALDAKGDEIESTWTGCG
jgi:hypothetical protein